MPGLVGKCGGNRVGRKKNQHSATIRVKTGSGENYQGILSLGNSHEKQYICKVLKYSFTDCKGKNSNHIVKRLNHGLAGHLKLVSPMGADKHHVTLEVTP